MAMVYSELQRRLSSAVISFLFAVVSPWLSSSDVPRAVTQVELEYACWASTQIHGTLYSICIGQN